MKLNPGQCVVQAFGGATKAAKEIGVSTASISRWYNGKRRITPRLQLRILEIAKKLKLDITANDLILGR